MDRDSSINMVWSRFVRKGQKVYEWGSRFSQNGAFVAIHTWYYPLEGSQSSRQVGTQVHICKINRNNCLRLLHTVNHQEWCCYAINNSGDLLLTFSHSPGVLCKIISIDKRVYSAALLGFNSVEKSVKNCFEVETTVARYRLKPVRNDWKCIVLGMCLKKKFDKQRDVPCITIPTDLKTIEYKRFKSLLLRLKKVACAHLFEYPKNEIARYISDYVDEAIFLINEIVKGSVDGGETHTITCLDLEEKMNTILKER